MGFAAALPAIVLGVLATAGTIFLLYWVRPEPQPVVVPSNLIWRRVLDERRRREDFWRWFVSLAIALLVGLAVVLALARPQPGSGAASSRTVLVMDTSPSLLAAVPGGGTRWDRALEQARRLVVSGNDLSEFLVLDTAGQRGGRSFSGRRGALEALEGMSPVYGADHRFPELSDLLLAGTGGPPAEVVLIGDGVLVPEAPVGVERISVFEPVANAGITAFDVRPLPTDPGRFEAFIEVVLHAAGAERDGGVVALQLDGVGGASLRRALRVSPGEPRGETVPLTGFVAGPVRAVIAAGQEDGFALDDEAHSYIPGRNRLRVFFAGADPYWRAALQLDPRVSLTRPTPGSDPFADFDAQDFDLVVIEGEAPPPSLAAPVLFAGSGTADWLPPRLAPAAGGDAGSGEAGASGTEEAEAAAASAGKDAPSAGEDAAVTLPVRPEASGHPLLLDLDFGDALARAVSAFDADAFDAGTAGAWTLLLGDARLGLMAVRELPIRGLAFAFPLAASNLPLQPDFPVFLSRALSWLTDVEVRRTALGQVRVAMPSGSVFDPEGRAVPSRRLGSEISFEAARPSLYYAAGGGREIVVAASLLDRQVSDLNRSAWAGEPSSPLAAAGSPGRTLWPFLVLFAFLLLVAEWIAFHRHATV